jgi:hypothetical protein
MGPRPLVIYTFGESVLMDFCAIFLILQSAMHFLGADETPKGKVFEDYVAEIMTKAGFQQWQKGELCAFDGSKREVDYSFINRNALFLCELKCINRSFAFEAGKTEAIKFRTDKLSSALDECDGKALWLSSRPQGKNYKLPQEVAAIVPVVVSPFPEYVWSRRDDYWLTEEIPRVCVPEELKSLNEPEVLTRLLKKPFIRYVY